MPGLHRSIARAAGPTDARSRLPLRRGHRAAPAALGDGVGQIGREFRAVAVSTSRAELRVLRDFESAGDFWPPLGALLDPGADRRAAHVPWRTMVDRVCWNRSRIARRCAMERPMCSSCARKTPPIARPAQAGSQSGRSLAAILSSCRCCAAAASDTRDAAELERGVPHSAGLPFVAADRRTAGQPPGPAVQHRSRPHRRQRSAGRVHDGVRSLRRGRHAVLATASRPPDGRRGAHTRPRGMTRRFNCRTRQALSVVARPNSRT